MALLDILKKTLLGKQVNGVEWFDGSKSRGASLYVTDDPRRRTPEENVNLMLVREGFARYSGDWNSGDGNLGGMAEAQRLAQEERKGIWAHEPVPTPPQPPDVTDAPPEEPPPNPPPPTEVEPPEDTPVENTTAPWSPPLLIGVLILGGTVALWRYLRKKGKS